MKRILSVVMWYGLIMGLLYATPALSQPQEPAVAVGDTMKFWSYQRSYFYSGYFQTEAICRAVGEKCYIFVEKERWNFGDVDSNDVAVVLDAFDHATTAVDSAASGVLASTAGIYDKVASVFGPPPDFDDDPRIYILIMDVKASGESGWDYLERSIFGPRSEYGYFDPVNEYSALVDSFSNEHELLYLDSRPLNPSSRTALASLAHNLQKMIHWYHDPDEDRWLTDGCSMLAEFLCGYSLTTGYFPPMDPFVSITYYNVYDYYREEYIDVTWQPNEVQNSMLIHFFFEKYGQLFFTALVADDADQSVASIDSTLAALGYEERFSQVFEDFVLTWYFLSLGLAADSTFFEGRYSLKYITPAMVRGTIVNTFMYWGLPGFLEPPYPYEWVSSWSAAFIAMTADFSGTIDSVVVFNGEDHSEYSVVVIKTSSSWMQPLDPQSEIEFLTLDSENRGYSDATGYKTDYKTIYMAVVMRWLSGPGTFYISDDITPPDSLNLSIFHGPIDDQALDFYIFSDEQVISRTQNSPLVELSYGNVTDTLRLERFRPITRDPVPNEPHIYHGDYTLAEPGLVTVRVEGQDVSGNHAPDHMSQFSINVVPAKAGDTITSPDGRLILDIPAGSLDKDTWVSVMPQETDGLTAGYKALPSLFANPKPKQRATIGRVYRIGPMDRQLHRPAALTMHFDPSDCDGLEGEPAIYRSQSGEWVYIGGCANIREGNLTASVDRFGEYQIQLGPHEEKTRPLPTVFDLGQNYPNPFNATTHIHYTIPVQSGEWRVKSGENTLHSEPLTLNVSLKVYNILGQEVSTLVDREQSPGYYTVRWDGQDNSGRQVASGVYFYRLSVDQGRWSDTRKMILLQ